MKKPISWTSGSFTVNANTVLVVPCDKVQRGWCFVALIWLEYSREHLQIRKDVVDEVASQDRLFEVLGVKSSDLEYNISDLDEPVTVLVLPTAALKTDMLEVAKAAYVRYPVPEVGVSLTRAIPCDEKDVKAVLKCMGYTLSAEVAEEQLEEVERKAFEAKLAAVHRRWEENRYAIMAQNGVMRFAPPKPTSMEDLFSKYPDGEYRRVDTAAAWLGWVLARKPEE